MQNTLKVAVISESEKFKGQGVHTAFVDMVSAFQRRSDVTVAVNDTSFPADITHVHTVGLGALRRSLQIGAPHVVSGHVVPDSLRGSLVGANLWLPLFEPYLRWYYSRAKAVVAVSPYTKDQLEKFGVKTRIEVIPNGVNRLLFKKDAVLRAKKREMEGYTEHDFVVMGSGQVQPRKGIASFVHVARMLPDVEFVWVGGRPFGKTTEGYDEMTELMDTAPANCHFIGTVPYEEMPEWHNAADLFWLPSLQETFGLVITESASCGKPVLVRDIETYTELFAPYYASATDDDGFAAQIVRFKTDAVYREEYRQKAEKLAERYNWDTIAGQMVTLYKDLLSAS